MTRTIALALATLALLPAVASAAAGDPDPSFDGDGKRTVPQPYTANEVLVQPDGKIIVVGNGGPANDFVITRLLADGSHDRSFDGDGTAIVDFEGEDQANAAALQPDGRIVIAGERAIEADDDLAVVRLLATGKPDTTSGRAATARRSSTSRPRRLTPSPCSSGPTAGSSSPARATATTTTTWRSCS